VIGFENIKENKLKADDGEKPKLKS